MKITVRATRAYLGGFGTSGSLLAGAATLFVLGSAIVAFRGWPQIATGPAIVSVAAAHSAAPTRVSRRLAAALKARRATGGASVAPTRGRRTARVQGIKIGAVGRGAPTSSIGTPAFRVPGSSASCGGASCSQPGSSSLVTSLTNAVSQEVTSIGASVGSRVGSGSNAVAGSLSGTSPQAANAVQKAGSSGGSTVSGTATTAGSAVTQVGNALGGGGH